MIDKIKNRTYEILEVAGPGDLFSRRINWAILVLVLFNTGVQCLDIWWPKTLMEYLQRFEWWPGKDILHYYFLYYSRWFEWLFIGLLIVEYLARMWSVHAAGGTHLAARLRFGLRPLQIADLIVILNFFFPIVLFDLRFLRLLRCPRLIDHISLTYNYAEPPEEITGYRAAIGNIRRQLSEVRQTVREEQEKDLHTVRQRTESIIEDLRRIQHNVSIQLRRHTQALKESLPQIRETVQQIFDSLRTDLSNPNSLAEVEALNQAAFRNSSSVFDSVPEKVSYEHDLNWKDRQSYRLVPLRQIGSSHFGGLENKADPSYQQFEKIRIEGSLEGLDSVFSTLRYVLNTFENDVSQGDGILSPDVQMGFNRAINRLRDLNDYTRMAWESLLWDLECEHQERLDLVNQDAARYGRIAFWFAKFGRFGRQIALAVLRESRQVLLRFLQFLRAQGTVLFNAASSIVKPLLRRLGLLAPAELEVRMALDKANLESIRQLGLPEDYIAHFDLDYLIDETLCVGFDDELATIEQAIQRWEDGLTSSFILFGQRGAGKTTLLNIAILRLFDDASVVTRSAIERKMTTESELVSYLADILEIEDVASFDDLARSLLQGPRRAVILEGCHNLFLKRIGGLGAIRHLFWLIARTNHHILWGICLDQHARGYLGMWLPLGRLFHFEVGIRAWQPAELQMMIMQRHNQSGYRLRYAVDKGLEKAVRRRVHRWRHPEEPAVQDALSQIYFKNLAEISRENIFVALLYWLRSLEPSESELLVVNPASEIDLGIVRDFSLEQAFILTAMLQHDNLTAAELSSILDRDLIQTRLELEILWNDNILEFDQESERFRINPIGLNAIEEMLRGRGLL